MSALSAEALLALPPSVRARRELLPLLHHALERDGRLGELTTEERALARRAYFSAMARVPFFREGIVNFLDDARAVDARPLLLKGAALAFTLYDDPATRPMADLDIACDEAAIDRLTPRLVARGYRRFGDGRARFALDHTHHAIFFHERAPTLELHVRLIHEMGVDGRMPGWDARAQLLPSAIGALPVPAMEDLLYHALVHAASHAFGDSALWLIDTALLLERAPESGNLLDNTARAQQAVAALHFACAIARRAWPSLALPEVKTPHAAALRRAILHAALGEDPLARAPGPWQSLLARLALTDDAVALLRLLAVKLRLRAVERFIEHTSERG